MKRFELTENSKVVYGRTVYQIMALTSFGDVKEGDFGGWIEEEGSLKHDGVGWVYEKGVVFNGGTIMGGAIYGGTIKGGTITGGAIYGGTIMGGTIMGGAIYGGTIMGGTIMGGTIKGGTITGGTIYGGTIKGGAIMGGTIKGGTIMGGTIMGGTIMGGTSVTKTVIALLGLKWTVTITDKHISIGCQTHSFEFWETATDKTIQAMDINALEWWKAHKQMIMTLVAENRKQESEVN